MSRTALIAIFGAAFLALGLAALLADPFGLRAQPALSGVFTLADLCLSDPAAALAYLRGDVSATPTSATMSPMTAMDPVGGGSHETHALTASIAFGLGLGGLTFGLVMMLPPLAARSTPGVTGSDPVAEAQLALIRQVAAVSPGVSPADVAGAFTAAIGPAPPDLTARPDGPDARATVQIADEALRVLEANPEAGRAAFTAALMVAWTEAGFSRPALQVLSESACELGLDPEVVGEMFLEMPRLPDPMLRTTRPEGRRSLRAVSARVPDLRAALRSALRPAAPLEAR